MLPAWATTVMPDSFTRAQNGSKVGSAGGSRSVAVRIGAGRITMVRASFSIAHSSSAMAQSRSQRLMLGLPKMRSW